MVGHPLVRLAAAGSAQPSPGGAAVGTLDRAPSGSGVLRPLVAFDARDALAPELRGWGRYAKRLLDALPAALGEEAELWPVEGGGRAEVLFEQFGLPLRLRRRGAALVHSPNCFLPLVRPCPGVVTIHDLAFEAWPDDFAPRTRLKYRAFTRLAARLAERVICPSHFTAQDLGRRYGIPAEKVRVIPEAPALPLSAAGGAPSGTPGGGSLEDDPPPYVLAVGDLRAKKNLGALVRAWAALRRADGIPHRLVLAGIDSGAGAQLRRIAGGQPLELCGYVDDARLDALLRGAEVLIHPSLYEGFGLVVLEAMARGTPVLAARATALPETGGEAAAWFDPGGADGGAQALQGALARILAEAPLRTDLSRRGVEWAARFSWERAARETAAVYRELL